jgi:arylsulfatase A-like enzyme
MRVAFAAWNMGPGIPRGRFDRTVLLNDVAPTLATLLGIETPSGSTGEVLPVLDPGGSRAPVARGERP